MASTTLFTKQAFIKWVTEKVPTDQIIVLSNAVNGEMSVTKKKGLNIPFSFDTAIFTEVKQHGVGHIAKGESSPWSFLVSNPDIIGEVGMKHLITEL